MRKYKITGMSCAACSARVERAVSAVEGVTKCSVNLLTNSMMVEGNAKNDSIISAVVNAGYGAEAENVEAGKSTAKNDPGVLENKDIPILRGRLIASAVFLILLMYISMGHLMWGWPLPRSLAENPMALGLSQLILSAIIINPANCFCIFLFFFNCMLFSSFIFMIYYRVFSMEGDSDTSFHALLTTSHICDILETPSPLPHKMQRNDSYVFYGTAHEQQCCPLLHPEIASTNS